MGGGEVSHFEEAVKRTLLIEGDGGGKAVPGDRGGATRWGITEAVARGFGYAGPMSELSRDAAVAIYKALYWDKLKLSGVAYFSPRIAYELFDSAVNIGTEVVAKWLQRCLNALNNEAKLYPDMAVDGVVGQETLTNLRLYFEARKELGEKVLHAALNGLQTAHYIGISEGRPTNERFTFGWIAERVVEK